MGRGWKPVTAKLEQAQTQPIADVEDVELVDLSPTGASDNADQSMAVDSQSADNSLPQAIAAPAPTPATRQSAIPDLDVLISQLSPDQIARLKVVAAARGVAVPAPRSGTRNVDGSLDVLIHLEPEVVEQLQLWSEPDGLDLVQTAQKYVSESLTAFLYGDWNPQPEPAPTATVTK